MNDVGGLVPGERPTMRAEPFVARLEDRLMLTLRRIQGAPVMVRAGVVAVFAVLATVVDWVTGADTSAMLEYAVAAAAAAWLCGLFRAVAIVVVTLAISTVVIADIDEHPLDWQAWTNMVLRGATLLLIVVVVASLRRHIDRAEFVAHVDPLTGCWSRRALLAGLDDAVHEAHRSRTPLTVLYLDLDRLKAINDSEGHAAGDDTIRRFADVVVRHGRRTDVLGRVGGDEFLVICPGTDAIDARRFADRLLADPDLPQVSIGIAELVKGQSAPQLLAEADAAMYRAKGR